MSADPESSMGESAPIAARRRPSRVRGRFDARSALILVGLFAAAWVVFIFAGALARANDLDARLSDARAETAALAAQVEAGYAEIEFIETAAFLGQASRGLGFGEQGEEAFALPPDAPPPEPIVPVGSTSSDLLARTPLDAWLELLFGDG